MTLAVVGPLVVVGAGLTFIALERRFPADRQELLREGFWTDLGMYTVVQNYVLGWVIATLIAFVDAATGWSRLGLLHAWSVPEQLALFLVTHDFYIYWFHRLQHRSPLLWRIHEAHHSTRSVDWLSGARSHPLEILINQTVEFAPMVLLGAAPAAILLKGMIDAVWGMFIHSNLRVRLGRLRYLLNGPELHRLHHAAQTEGGTANFGTKLAMWDWLFGTARTITADGPAVYGLADSSMPTGYWRQIMYAFRSSP